MNRTLGRHIDPLVFFWPALLILEESGRKDAAGQREEMVRNWLRLHLFSSVQIVLPDLLKSPAPPGPVFTWLARVCESLRDCAPRELARRRQSLVAEIVRSRLPQEEQTNLIAAVDYLARLSRARAGASPEGGRNLLPSVRSKSMQAAYRTLAELAATDIPVWLCGEKGVELERTARLIHALRGLPEAAFHVWHCAESSRDSVELDRMEWEDFVPNRGDATVVALNADEAPRTVQRMLYRRMVRDLSSNPSVHLMVTSGPVDLCAEVPSRILTELFAFLSPARVEIPPLRSRSEDIEGLVNAFAAAKGITDPMKRWTPDALARLREYHWPGNTDELEMVAAFTMQARPTGSIGLEDLPASLGVTDRSTDDMHQRIGEHEALAAFRGVGTPDGRRKLAHFLNSRRGERFTASEFQTVFGLGRETVRRLLRALEESGIIQGIAGATGQRVTRYEVAAGPEGPGIDLGGAHRAYLPHDDSQ